MNNDTTITALHQPGSILDPLSEIALDGARQMLAAAIKAEAASFVALFSDCPTGASAWSAMALGRSG